MNEHYDIMIPLRIKASDKANDVRSLLAGAFRQIASLITRQWLMDTRTYDVDIEITMTPKDNS